MWSFATIRREESNDVFPVKKLHFFAYLQDYAARPYTLTVERAVR